MFEQREISKIVAIAMGAIALVIDLLQFGIGLIPILGDIIGFLIGAFGYCIFWLWFKIYGIDFISPKRFLTILAGGILEFAGIVIPEIDLPGLTLTVVGLILLSRIPAAQKAMSLMEGKVSGAKGAVAVPPGRLTGRELDFRNAAEERRPLYGKGGKLTGGEDAPKALPMAEDPYKKSLSMRRERPITDEERRTAAIERSKLVSDRSLRGDAPEKGDVLPGDENSDILAQPVRAGESAPKRIMDEREGDRRVRMVSNETLKPKTIETRKRFEEKDGDVQKAA